MSTSLILNVVLAIIILTAVIAVLTWAIRTQRRDRSAFRGTGRRRYRRSRSNRGS